MGVSSAVIVVSLSLAFSTWIRTVLSVMFSLAYTAVEDWLGWRNKKRSYNSTAIKNMQRERMKQLESRDRARRLTEIDGRRMTPRGEHVQQHSTWDVRRLASPKGMFSRFRRKSLEGQEPV